MDREITYVPQGRRVAEVQLAILEELVLIRRELRIMQQQITDAFAALQTEVASVRDNEQAAVTLIQGLQTQLNAALNSSSDPTEVVAAVQAVTNQLTQDAAPLAAAVAANTPAPTPTPTPTPAPTDTGTGTAGDGTTSADPTA